MRALPNPSQEQHVRPGIHIDVRIAEEARVKFQERVFDVIFLQVASARPLITQLFVMSSRPVQLLKDLASAVARYT